LIPGSDIGKTGVAGVPGTGRTGPFPCVATAMEMPRFRRSELQLKGHDKQESEEP